jgi:hypothetical protein
MLVLFACLAVAVTAQALSVVTVIAERSLVEETTGRERLEERDRGLALLQGRALREWEPLSWEDVGGDGAGVEGCLVGLPDDEGWVMKAIVRQDETVSRLTTSAWVERGRDGIDLPLAGLVGGSISTAADRATSCLENEPGFEDAPEGTEQSAGAVAYIDHAPTQPLTAPGWALRDLAAPWRLDPGWRALGEGAQNVAPGGSAVLVAGRQGRLSDMPSDRGGLCPESPVLVVVTGGGDLDARGRGDLYGVIVVDEGSVLLDGTTLHGAAFATETVDFGKTGRLVFSRSLLRWATDRSLARTRLVPGTREEGME